MLTVGGFRWHLKSEPTRCSATRLALPCCLEKRQFLQHSVIARPWCRIGDFGLCRLSCGAPFRHFRDFPSRRAREPQESKALVDFESERRRITKPAPYQGPIRERRTNEVHANFTHRSVMFSRRSRLNRIYLQTGTGTKCLSPNETGV